METLTPNSSDRFVGFSSSLASLCITLVVMSAAGMWFYQLAFLDTLKFFLAVFILFYIPGSLVRRIVGFQFRHNLTSPIISLATGVVLIPAIYKMLQPMDRPGMVLVGLLLICFVSWLFWVFRPLLVNRSQVRVGHRDLLALLLILIFILTLLQLSHFSDVILNADGFQYRANHMTESVFHLGLINGMTDSYPPPAIYASGGPDFSFYHLNMHLQADLLIHLAGLGSLQVVYFYLPLLYFVLLVMLPYVFVRECGGRVLTALICALLVFGTDFSFVPALFLTASEGFAWTGTFQSTIWGLFTLNGVIPGLIALLLGIYCLRDYFQDESLKKLVFLMVVTLCSFGFKSSVGIQFALAIAATAVLMSFFAKQKKPGLILLAAACITLMLMLFDLYVLRSGTGNSVVVFAPLMGFKTTLIKLGLSQLSSDLYIPLFLLVLLGGLGVRVLGLYFLYTRIRQKGPPPWILVFIGLFFLSGYAAWELFFIGQPGSQSDSKWFHIQSLVAVSYLLFYFLIKMQDNKKAHLVFLLIIVTLSIPSTVQFLSLRYDNTYINYGPAEMRIIEYLRDTSADSIVLHPLNQDRPSLASNFAGRTTVLSVWLSFITESDGLSERVNDTQFFFNVETDTSARQEILNKYGVDYVYGSRSEMSAVEETPGLVLELSSGEIDLYRYLSTPRE